MIEIIVCGAFGRMGRAIVSAAESDTQVNIAGLVDAKDHPALSRAVRFRGVEIAVSVELPRIARAVVIDFSTPEGTEALVPVAADRGFPVVIGTTGLSGATEKIVEAAASKVAIVRSANMSTGVNVLMRLVREAARALGPDADVEIIEVHHNRKKDAPSGTALAISDVVAQVRGGSGGEIVYGRRGKPGERKAGEVGIHAVRAGDIAGDHTVMFGMNGERIELVHRAHGRGGFAAGALRAAKFVSMAKPGLYGMNDVLGFEA